MKSFLYKGKTAVALTLAMSLFCPQVFAAEALSAAEQGVQEPPAVEVPAEEILEQAIPLLTEKEALAKAIKRSPGLKDLEDSLELLREQDEKLYDRVGSIDIPSYEYKRWEYDGLYQLVSAAFTMEQNMKQINLTKDVQKLALEMAVKTYFANIISLEDTVKLLEDAAAMQKKAYDQGYTKYRLGMLSKYNLEQLRINKQKAEDTLAMTENGLEQLYISFNSLIGEQPEERFEFIYEITFQPYELPLPIDQYISNEMKDDLSIKLQELSLNSAKFKANYRNADAASSTQDSDNLSYDIAKRGLKTAKAEKETLMRNTYLKIKSLETEYSSAQADLMKAQADYRVAQVSYQTGAVTKLAVEGAAMAVAQAEMALNSVVNEHNMLVYQFENPALLSNTQQR